MISGHFCDAAMSADYQTPLTKAIKGRGLDGLFT
jgi:hypothetical protein